MATSTVEKESQTEVELVSPHTDWTKTDVSPLHLKGGLTYTVKGTTFKENEVENIEGETVKVSYAQQRLEKEVYRDIQFFISLNRFSIANQVRDVIYAKFQFKPGSRLPNHEMLAVPSMFTELLKRLPKHSGESVLPVLLLDYANLKLDIAGNPITFVWDYVIRPKRGNSLSFPPGQYKVDLKGSTLDIFLINNMARSFKGVTGSPMQINSTNMEVDILFESYKTMANKIAVQNRPILHSLMQECLNWELGEA